MEKNFFRKIFGIIFLAAIFLFQQNVFAEKTDYADKSYNFKGVSRVALLDIESNVSFSDKGNIFRQKLLGEYLDKSKKLKCPIITGRSISELEGLADVYVRCKIRTWEDSSYIVPERTTWESKEQTRRIRDYDGNWIEERYTIVVPVVHPPYKVYVSDIVVDFEVYDVKTGKMVFGREDDRSRDDFQAQPAMFGRMCNSFFEDFRKKIK